MTVPDVMRAYVLESFGGPDVYAERELPVPTPGPGEALVRVAACGICGEDVMARAGRIPHYERLLPVIMGHELSGEVVSLGPGTTRVAVGDRVITRQGTSCHECGFCRNGRETICQHLEHYGETVPGGYGEYVVLDAQGLVKVPDGIDHAEACIITCAIGTVVHAMKLARVTAGEHVLVTGASGGLGIHALQLIAAYGAKSIAITSTPERAKALEEYADMTIVAQDGKFASEVRRSGTQPEVVIELTAGITLDQSLRSVARAGRVVVVGNVDPRPVEILPGALLVREIELIGSVSADRESIEDSVKMVADGRVRAVVGRRFDFSDLAAAHAAVENREVVGRVVLENR